MGAEAGGTAVEAALQAHQTAGDPGAAQMQEDLQVIVGHGASPLESREDHAIGLGPAQGGITRERPGLGMPRRASLEVKQGDGARLRQRGRGGAGWRGGR
ncbi:hypothetical protein AZSI13_24950 [Azospira sp. I13]|nr:hypothetical protein AZSI13_24950 [Azospira sp. I13]